MSKYHKGDKFIVDIKEVIESDNGRLYRSNFKTLTFDDNGLDKLQKYEEVQIPYSEAYNKGLEDAWELAKKISDIDSTSERARIFNYVVGGITVVDILRDFAPQEALAKLEAYEKEQNEIKVGDVVFNKDTNEHCVITHIEGKLVVYCLYDDGSCGTSNIKECEKTYKHIDIQSLLEQIKE